MTRKLLTIDEFRASAKDGSRPEGAVFRVAVADPVAASDSRNVRFVFSDASVDRSGDSIDQAGWKTDAYRDNPVALWAHDSSSPPIGRSSNVGTVGGKLMGDIEFMSQDISAFADSIYRMVTAGFIKAVSVGFIPLEYTFSKDKNRPYGIDFTKQELLEISVCPVPCNPNALQEAKSMGIDTGPLRDWASKVLDEGNHVLIPRNLLEETFRQAKTPRTTRQKYLAKSEAADWKVGAADDLAVADSDAWDGAAAAKRILDDASFDGDSPDAAKAARGFLIHDAANPVLRSSYKLPFADIVDGELKAIKSGVAAAQARLAQTEAPADVLDEAKEIAAEYEQKDVSLPVVNRHYHDDQPRDGHGRWGSGGSTGGEALRNKLDELGPIGRLITSAHVGHVQAGMSGAVLGATLSAFVDSGAAKHVGLISVVKYGTQILPVWAKKLLFNLMGFQNGGKRRDASSDDVDVSEATDDQIVEFFKGLSDSDAKRLASEILMGSSAQNRQKILDTLLEMEDSEKHMHAPMEKSGRRISNANAAKLQEAMDHHASATKCIKDVMDSNAAADPDGDDDSNEPDADAVPVVVVLTAEELREQRLTEARALKASVKI